MYGLIKKIATDLNCGILLISHDLHFRNVSNHACNLP